MLGMLLKKRKGRERPKIELAQSVVPSKRVVIGGKEITVKDIKQITEEAIIVEDLQGNVVVIPLRRGEEDVGNVRAVLL